MSTFSTPSEDNFNLLEALEPRIAPAGINPAGFQAAPAGTQILLHAGEGLSTGSGNSGSWLVYVEKGSAIVYTTDLNSNGQIDANEITGISAGDGLRLISFVDIHGDIVTNLDANGNLTDSDPSSPGRDGKILLNSKIEAITMRSVTASDVPAGTDPLDRLALSSYSIYGNIYAGGGFGVVGGGLTIDTSGYDLQLQKFDGTEGSTYLPAAITPTIGSIKVGSAASGGFFNFGVTSDNGVTTGLYGTLRTFKPATGQAGADIIGVSATSLATTEVDPVTGEVVTTLSNVEFRIGDLIAGDGGFGARGGNIQNVSLFGDTGTTHIIAGKGGDGPTGGAGGSILNLSDTGSNTGRMIIETGAGGSGLTGTGGAGGSLTFGTFSAVGKVSITLGDGGDGLMSGGAGASLSAGTVSPIGNVGLADPLAVVSTTHIKWVNGLNGKELADNIVGKPFSVDFDGDGNSDLVYLTTDPQQMVVVYGNGTTAGISTLSEYTILDVPNLDPVGTNPPALVVGDVNGDGFDDIVVGSNSENSLGGIMTFLSKGTSREFQSPIFNAMPFFSTPEISLNSNGGRTVFNGPGAIIDLELGDFNGDGLVDFAAVSHNYTIDVGGTHDATLLYMAQGVGNGLFYVNFGKTTGGLINQLPYTYINDTHNVFKIEATATSGTAGGSLQDRDILVGSVLGDGDRKAIRTFVFSTTPPPTSPYDAQILQSGSVTAVFKVRKNDNGVIVPDGDPIAQTPTDFTVLSVGGVFAVAAINEDPQALTLLQGAVDGTMTQPSADAGIALTGNGGLVNTAATFKGIVAVDVDGNGTLDNFGIYTFTQANAKVFYQFTAAADLKSATLMTPATVDIQSPQTPNQQVIIFDAYRAKVNPGINDDAKWGYSYAEPALDDSPHNYIRTTTGTGGGFYLTERFFEATVGDGGSSKLGNGGNGGSITNLKFVIPANLGATFDLTAGDGGNGAKNGGNGGAISGITSTFLPGTRSAAFQLFAGDGGNGLAVGGKGGDISNLSLQRGYTLIAGDGGSGKIGGDGGSLIGRGVRTAGLTDVQNTGGAEFYAGNGGSGVTVGGKGGSITSLVSEVSQVTGGDGQAGYSYYVAGNGGSATGGRGGDGGSVLNSSPLENSFTAGDIIVGAGDGGNGLTGGNGGSITSFKQSSNGDGDPKAISVIAGNGGNGVIGNGGAGGSITSVEIDGSGVGDGGFLKFNRFIAGNGGHSFGAIGGAGGSIISSSTVSKSTSAALAAGAGGDGLTKGGVGGSITNSFGNSSTQLGSQTLVIAGAGGDAFAFTAASISGGSTFENETLAYGGTLGFGGNGGSISNYTQKGTVNGATNLIAGDGGSTRNYGTAADAKFNVGKGGSITNIKLAGDAGAIDPNTAIVSYTSTQGVETNREFVQQFLLGTPYVSLTNSVGNVGVIVGVAGNVANGAPSSPLLNGSVSGFTAQNIMSMVAGSVDRIASILSISNITALQGVYGAEKVFPNHLVGQPSYYSGPNQTGTIVNKPVIGGSLGDGAIVGQKITGIQGARVFPL